MLKTPIEITHNNLDYLDHCRLSAHMYQCIADNAPNSIETFDSYAGEIASIAHGYQGAGFPQFDAELGPRPFVKDPHVASAFNYIVDLLDALTQNFDHLGRECEAISELSSQLMKLYLELNATEPKKEKTRQRLLLLIANKHQDIAECADKIADLYHKMDNQKRIISMKFWSLSKNTTLPRLAANLLLELGKSIANEGKYFSLAAYAASETALWHQHSYDALLGELKNQGIKKDSTLPGTLASRPFSLSFGPDTQLTNMPRKPLRPLRHGRS